MLFAYLLALIIIVSTVIATPTVSIKRPFQNVENTIENTDPSNDNDRTKNVEFLQLIRHSNEDTWSQIKKYSLTINNNKPELNELFNKSPEDLSDQQLDQFTKICYDGFMCMTVDKLVLLKSESESIMDKDKNMSITIIFKKIIKVVNIISIKFGKGTRTYQEANENDDNSKIYKSVTAILQDYEKLCSVNVSADSKGNTNDKIINNGTVVCDDIIDNTDNNADIAASSKREDSDKIANDNSTIVDQSETMESGKSLGNMVSLKNISKNNDGNDGENTIESGITTAGSYNKNRMNTGLVVDGILNNGKAVVYNINNGVINKGIISDSNANGGIINVGTVNAGHTNYGDVKITNKTGPTIEINNVDPKMRSIEKIYSFMLNNLKL